MNKPIEITIDCYKGHLSLHTVTPVIEALFGLFDLGTGEIIDGRLSFTHNQQGTISNPSWNDIGNKVIKILKDEYRVDVNDHKISSVHDILLMFVSVYDLRYGLSDEKKIKFGKKLAQINFNGPVFVGSLFRLAKLLNDGHGLTEMQLVSYEHVTNIDGTSRVVQTAYIHTDQVSYVDSAKAIELGKILSQQLTENDYDAALELLFNEVNALISSIVDPKKRAVCATRLIQLLTASYIYKTVTH